MTPNLHLDRGSWKTAGEGHEAEPGFQKSLLGIVPLQLHVSTGHCCGRGGWRRIKKK